MPHDITPELEKVARAIATACVRAHVDEYDEPDAWAESVRAYDITNNSQRYSYVCMASAALMALREPTEGMYTAAGYRDPTEATWPRMIDYVLGVKHE